MKNSYQELCAIQRYWAAQKRISVDADGFTYALEDNLFLPLSNASRSEFGAGSGGERGGGQKRAKMQALHSSSALVERLSLHTP